MKANKNPAKSAKTAARPLAAPWLERPNVDLALRVGTAAMMAIAAALVLAHLSVQAQSLTSQSFAAAQSTACTLARC